MLIRVNCPDPSLRALLRLPNVWLQKRHSQIASSPNSDHDDACTVIASPSIASCRSSATMTGPPSINKSSHDTNRDQKAVRGAGAWRYTVDGGQMGRYARRKRQGGGAWSYIYISTATCQAQGNAVLERGSRRPRRDEKV